MEKVSGSNLDPEANQSLLLTIRLWHAAKFHFSHITSRKADIRD